MMFQQICLLIVAVFMVVQSTYALPQNDINTILQKHNQYRAKHGAPALKWDKNIAQFAQRWSTGCAFQHSGNPSYGENIAMGYDSWDKVVSAWYDEVDLYDYNNPGFAGSTGHFTQVVWVGTSKIGCGFTECGGRKIYSCNYKKPGNYMGQFPENVLPPKSN